MLRKIHTSQSRQRFYHEQAQQQTQIKSNNITRPPTSHPYSSIRNMRSHQTLHNSNFFPRSPQEKNAEIHNEKANDVFEEAPFAETLPKIFGHMLTEIRILFRGRDKKEERTITILIGSLSKKINDLFAQGTLQKQKIKDLSEEVEELKRGNEELEKKIKQMRNLKGQENSVLKARSKTKNYELVMENLKLTQLNAVYLSTIRELESNQKEKQVETHLDSRQHQNTEVLRHLNRISYLQMKLKNAEEKENQMNASIQDLKKKKSELQEKIENLIQSKNQLQEKQNQWREIAQMGKEDTQMHLTRQNFLLYSIKKLREMNKGLTQKLLNQATTTEGQGMKNQIEPNPYFQYEVDFFKNIRSIYFDSKFKEFKMTLSSRKQQNQQFSNFELEDQYMEYRKHEEVNLTLFSYYFPKFYSFIEDSITTDITQTRTKGNTSVSRVFIQILRGIMRSKLNEFLMLGEEKYTRFPEFVYTWFEKFYFNSEKNDISLLQPYMQKPFSQELFYRDLMNVKLDQSWEIITFREFLLEELNLEELYFYLMCQNLLFRKAGINKIKQYQGDFSLLVEYHAAKVVLDMVLSDFESWNLTYLISKMREKIIYKKNVQYIDSGFFLRCLVQYYKIERINRYKYIIKLCDEFKSQERGLRFSSFISIINRFTQVSVEQKIHLYRQCFCLGKGKITPDIIFTVCTENLIFLKYLKLKCFFKLPLFSSQNPFRKLQTSDSPELPIVCVQPSDGYLVEIYSKMIELIRSEGHFHIEVEKMGLIEMTGQLNKLEKIFSEKQTGYDSSVLRCRHFMHFLSEMTSRVKVISFNHFYQLLEEQNKKKNNQTFWVDIHEPELCNILADEFRSTISIYKRFAEWIQWKNKVYDFRLHHAARKIQKMVRKKFIAPYMEIYKIIYSEFKPEKEVKS